MRKNAEDGGSRRFVLVQLPEEASGGWDNLCNVGEERIRRVGEKIKSEVDKANDRARARAPSLGSAPSPSPCLSPVFAHCA